jgi:hypothetical protein
MSTPYEHTAAKEAEAVLSSLAPSAPCGDKEIETMRGAADIATKAIENFSSHESLDAARADAATALRGVSGLPDGRKPTQDMQDMIDRAKSAVAAWLSELADSQ